MARQWTREERRKHIRERYFSWKEKVFVLIVCIAALLIILFLVITGIIISPLLRGIGAVLVIILALIMFFFSYAAYKMLTKILVLAAIALIIVLGFLTAGSLSGVEQVVAYVIMGFVFLIALAFAIFFIDMYTYESG